MGRISLLQMPNTPNSRNPIVEGFARAYKKLYGLTFLVSHTTTKRITIRRFSELSYGGYLLLVLILFVAILAYAYWALSYLYTNYFERVSSSLGPFWINVVGVFAIAIAGLFLYKVRQSYRIMYGLVEIAFSLVYGWFAVGKAAAEAASMVDTVAVVAVVYLMVRGADNVAIGWEARQENLVRNETI